MRLLKWFFTLPLILLLLVFALSNKDAATVSFWPFSFSLSLPLSFLLALSLALGLLLGGLTVWLGDLKYRFEAQHLRHEVTKLTKQLVALQNAAAPKPALLRDYSQPAPTRRWRWPKLEL